MISSASGVPTSRPEVQAELERILQSRVLRESKQLCALLSYAVRETLAGREDSLKEYLVGLEVFHRQPGYDPRNDAIVRVQASLLRKRLADYYEHEGRDSTLRIELPRGGYVTRFVTQPEPTPDLPAEPQPQPATVPSPRRTWTLLAAGLCAGLLLATAIAVWSGADLWPHKVESPALWGTFFEPGRETVVSFGVPLFYAGAHGFFVRDTQINTTSQGLGRLEEFARITGQHFRPQEDVYTGVGDAFGTHYVARWLEKGGVRTSVANSNYIGPSDVQGKNLVVVSSARFQTLLQQFHLPNLFPFDPTQAGDAGGFSVTNPLPGELPYYQPSGGSGVTTSFAVLSLWPGSTPGTRMLYLSGIETWATQGAAHYAIDPVRLRELQTFIEADPLDGPRGKKSPYFQVLIRVEGKNNRVRNSMYITHRYLPAAIPLAGAPGKR